MIRCLLARWAVILLAILLALLLQIYARVAEAASCRMTLVTAYSAEAFSGLTSDETSTWPNVGLIVAGGEGYELGQEVWIEGLGSLRVADRGNLGYYQIDRLVATTPEAEAWGRRYLVVCG